MRRFALTCALCTAAPAALAADWVRLDTDGIVVALTDTKYVYESGATQHFYASGRTLYDAGQDSWGTWEARDDRYCSQWPPASGWACYYVEQSDDHVRFIGDSGDITTGRRQ